VFGLKGETMGTTWSVKAVADEEALAKLRSEIDALFASIVAEMSAWDARSDLSRFNRADRGWHRLRHAFSTVLDCALQVARDADGAYDPTIWPLTELWGFGPAGWIGFPDGPAVAAAKARCGWRRLEFRSDTRQVMQPGGAAIDLCGIAKGYAVDCLAGLLQTRRIGNFLVEIGGELRGEGVRPDGNPWWVAVEAPRIEAQGALGDETIIALHGLAAATSGDYRRHHTRSGQRIAHIIDPRTGYPAANGIVSVTVLDRHCMRADALATALFVLGEEEGIAFASARSIPALFMVERDGCIDQRITPALAAMAA
jgi:thiamine biosynthesis lipoprotein